MSAIYSSIEDQIKAKLLAQEWAKTDIITAPERKANYKPPVPNIQLIVQYAGSKFGQSRTTDPVAQEEIGQFNVILQSRKLRDNDTGVYDVLDKIKKTLLGFQPTGCQRLQLVPDKGIEFIEFEDDLWQFAITFSTTWLTVQAVEESDDPTITQITLKDE